MIKKLSLNLLTFQIVSSNIGTRWTASPTDVTTNHGCTPTFSNTYTPLVSLTQSVDMFAESTTNNPYTTYFRDESNYGGSIANDATGFSDNRKMWKTFKFRLEIDYTHTNINTDVKSLIASSLVSCSLTRPNNHVVEPYTGIVLYQYDSGGNMLTEFGTASTEVIFEPDQTTFNEYSTYIIEYTRRQDSVDLTKYYSDINWYLTSNDPGKQTKCYSTTVAETDEFVGDKALYVYRDPDLFVGGANSIGAYKFDGFINRMSMYFEPATSTAMQDPHLRFANGAVADFRGFDQTLFNFLSSSNMNINIMTEFAYFKLKQVFVHGSFITQAHVKTKDATMSVYGSKIGDRLSIFANGTCANKFYKIGVHRNLKCGNTIITTNYSTIHVRTPDWNINVVPKHIFDIISGPKRRIDVQVSRISKSTTHGILGQSFSRDVKSGKQDVYPSSGNFTTSAMAEGSIEGNANEYIVKSAFDTNFKYSLFGKKALEDTDKHAYKKYAMSTEL